MIATDTPSIGAELGGDSLRLTRRSHLGARDVFRLATLGLRGRPARAVLSAAGIALGVATVVGVLGISTSSRAQLISEIDALGTNLLTVSPSPSISGGTPTLPARAPAMVRRIGPVQSASALGAVGGGVAIYRTDRIPAVNTDAVSVYAAQPTLLSTLQGHVARGRFLNAATANLPAVVLGASAASALGIDRADGAVEVWLGGRWFDVVGVLDPLQLAPELDRSAFVGFHAAEHLLGASGRVVEIFVRTAPASVGAVQSVLAATADPAAPQDVSVTDPTDALVARADASAAFESLFLAVGGVAVLVGGIGIANVMVISVLERRGEIGLRRALGATRAHIGLQFVAESALMGGVGGVTGGLLGGLASSLYSAARAWHAVVPASAFGAAVAAAVVVGAVAGLHPALKASRMAPAEALRTV